MAPTSTKRGPFSRLSHLGCGRLLSRVQALLIKATILPPTRSANTGFL